MTNDEKKFRSLGKKWKRETGMLSRIDKKCCHPSYQEIIMMGEKVIPFILEDLEKTHSDWFCALSAITGCHPIPKKDYGYIDKMVKAWLKWGEKKGYIS